MALCIIHTFGVGHLMVSKGASHCIYIPWYLLASPKKFATESIFHALIRHWRLTHVRRWNKCVILHYFSVVFTSTPTMQDLWKLPMAFPSRCWIFYATTSLKSSFIFPCILNSCSYFQSRNWNTLYIVVICTMAKIRTLCRCVSPALWYVNCWIMDLLHLWS